MCQWVTNFRKEKKNLEQKVLLRGKSLTQTLKLCSKGNHQLPNNPEVKDAQLLKSFPCDKKNYHSSWQNRKDKCL